MHASRPAWQPASVSIEDPSFPPACRGPAAVFPYSLLPRRALCKALGGRGGTTSSAPHLLPCTESLSARNVGFGAKLGKSLHFA